jgi:hypothetical protein
MPTISYSLALHWFEKGTALGRPILGESRIRNTGSRRSLVIAFVRRHYNHTLGEGEQHRELTRMLAHASI